MLARARATLAAAREGVRQMDSLTSDARWALSQIADLKRRGQMGQPVREALDELAEACESAAETGRVVDRHVRGVVADVRTAQEEASSPPAITQQDQIDQVALGARLAALEEDLLRTRPLVEQAVVRLGGTAYSARQAAGGPGPDARLLVVEQLDRRLVDATEAGAELRDHLVRAGNDTERAQGQVDVICEMARVRMASHRTPAPAVGDRTTGPGMGI